jgi:transposase-like protein
MNKSIKISEPDRLFLFMESFHENHSEDFKALALHLVSKSDIETVSKQIGVPISTLYDWQSDWNKKKNWDYTTTEDKVVE